MIQRNHIRDFSVTQNDTLHNEVISLLEPVALLALSSHSEELFSLLFKISPRYLNGGSASSLIHDKNNELVVCTIDF